VATARTLAAILLASAVARADDEEEVRVRGTEAGGFSSRVRIEDQPREVTDAASLVENEPGVHVRRLGGDDGFATLSIRGASSTQIAVLFAGVPLSGGGTPTVDLSSLPVWPGVSAHVYRTFAPGSLGPGSLGGTLAWDPPSVRSSERIETWAAVGSFGALRMRAGATTKLGRVRIASGVSASRADDDYPYYNDRFGLDPGAPEELIRKNAGHAQASGSVALAIPYRLQGGREGSVKIVTLLQGREQQLPGTSDVPTPNQRLRSDRELVSVEGTHPATSAVSTYAHFWAKREGLSLTDDPVYSFMPKRADQTVAAVGAAAGVRGRPLAKWRGDIRVEGRGERFIAGTYIGPKPRTNEESTPLIGATRAAVAAAADLEWHPIDPITAAFTARLEHLRDTAGEDANETTLGTAHAGFEVAKNGSAVAAHGGFVSRPPSFLERFGVVGGFIPTPDLRSESAWAIDWGARTAQKLGALRLAGEATVFGTLATDLIVFQRVGIAQSLKAENVGKALLSGLEMRGRAKWNPFELRASYTFMTTENQSGCGRTCPPLPNRPQHDLVVDALATVGLLRFRYGVDLIAGIRADDLGSIDVPARVLHSMGVRFRPPKASSLQGVEWSLDVRNLLDDRTATFPGFLGDVRKPLADGLGFPIPGRSVLLSVRLFTDADAP
jgi:hypothetical protein